MNVMYIQNKIISIYYILCKANNENESEKGDTFFKIILHSLSFQLCRMACQTKKKKNEKTSWIEAHP